MRGMFNAPAVPGVIARRKVLRRATASGMLLVVFLILALAYVRIGWDRMVTGCTADSPGHHPTSVEFGWSWSPPGFACAYEDGTADTSLWF